MFYYMSVVAKYLNCLGFFENSPPGKEKLQRHTEVEFLNVSLNIPYPTISTLNFSYFLCLPVPLWFQTHQQSTCKSHA